MREFVLAAAVASAVLVACGGGGGNSTAAVGSSGVATGSNVFDAVLGTYKSGCVVRPTPGGTQSQETTITLSEPAGTDQAKLVINQKYYDNATNCTGTLLESYIVSGQITAATATKAITFGTKQGVAKTAVVRYESLTLSQGSLAVPALGATAKVGYLIEGANLYVLSGTRDADGLPISFSSLVAVKQ